MNVEPQTHGLPDWNFPSPTSTPRSTVPAQAPFQTPKCEPSSHFLDAYYTPQTTGHQTPADTPISHDATLVRRPLGARTSPLTPYDPHFHVNHYKDRSLPLPPVEPARRLSSSPDLINSSNNLQKSLSTSQVRAEGLMDSFQMHTPPPTRDSSSRREFESRQQGINNAQVEMFEGPSQTPIRSSSLNIQQTPQLQTPIQYHQVQFSSELFHFQNGGPASAPAVPQTRYPWMDPSPSFSFANEAMMYTEQNAFAQGHPPTPGFSEWQAPNPSPMQQQVNFQPTFGQPAQAPDFWATPGVGPQPTTSFNEESSFVASTTGVNPSMIFSFSNPPQNIDPFPIRPNITPTKIDIGGRQPYEHQTRESNRERELAKKGRQAHSRTDTAASSVSFGTAARPGLQRSNTDSEIRRTKLLPAETQRFSQIAEQIDRRSSPLKRHSQASLSSIPEAIRPRPRTRLVIDESGRATTETVAADEDILNDRKSFGAVWDDDSSDEEEMGITSQRNSFIMPPEQLQRRSSKHARTGSESDRFEVSKRPVSSASISSLASRLETTPLGKRSSREMKDLNYRRFSSGSFVDNMGLNKDDGVANDSTDAQAALKKLVGGRSRRQERNDPQAVLNLHNQRWSQASIDLAKFSAIQEQSGAYDPFALAGTRLSPTSGTDPDVMTPSTEHSTRSNDSTRCVCNTTEVDGHLMVQCESCTKWLHVQCVGLDAQRLPPVYVCVFCTGTTPLARGGRIREPIRRSDNHASPLGYKSGNMFRR